MSEVASSTQQKFMLLADLLLKCLKTESDACNYTCLVKLLVDQIDFEMCRI